MTKDLEGNAMDKDVNLDTNTNDDNNTDSQGKTFPESVVKNLRKENADWRTKLRETQKKMEEMEAKFASIDTDKYFNLLEEEKNKEREKLEKEGQWEKIKEEMQKTHANELKAFQEKENAAIAVQQRLEAELNNTILSNQIAVEAAKAECLNPSVLQLILAQESTVEATEDGNRAIKILDKAGDQRINPKTGNPFTIADRIAEMKEDMEYAMLFRGGKYGGGSNTTQSQGTNGNPFKSGPSYNLTEQGRLIKEQPDLAKRLANEAGLKLTI